MKRLPVSVVSLTTPNRSKGEYYYDCLNLTSVSNPRGCIEFITILCIFVTRTVMYSDPWNLRSSLQQMTATYTALQESNTVSVLVCPRFRSLQPDRKWKWKSHYRYTYFLFRFFRLFSLLPSSRFIDRDANPILVGNTCVFIRQFFFFCNIFAK